MYIGAGIVIISSSSGRILFTRRADSNCWANFGGTLEDFETTYQCAIREIREETGFVHGKDYKIIGTKPVHIKESPNLTYYTYVASCIGEPIPVLNDENVDYGWFDSLPYPMHFGVEEVMKSKGVSRAIIKIRQKH